MYGLAVLLHVETWIHIKNIDKIAKLEKIKNIERQNKCETANPNFHIFTGSVCSLFFI